jgi:hypothetical protein
MTATMIDRIATQAADVRPLRVLLSVLAAPFYALGFVLGVALLAGAWCYAAIGVGIADAKARRVTDAG